MKRYVPLFEITYDINNDVDFLYNNLFKKYVIELKNKTFNHNLNKFYPLINLTGFLSGSIGSEELKDVYSKFAHSLKPIYIIGGVFDTDSKISFDKKIQDRNYIIISINKELVNLYINNNFSFKKLSPQIPNNEIQLIVNSLKDSYIKSMIYHELSYWLNNILNNEHISKTIELAKKYDNNDILKLKTKNIDLTHFEIDAQIHAIKQYKRDNEKNWDKKSLSQLFKLYPSLMIIYNSIKKQGTEASDIWLQTLVKRMHRENLLGKNMKPIIIDSYDI